MSSSDPVSETQWRNEVTQIITNFLKQRLSKRGYQWVVPHPVPEAAGSDHLLLNQTLSKIADKMLTDNGPEMRRISAQLVDQNILDYSKFRVIADQIFVDGFRWSHIVVLLLFGSELAFEMGVRSNSESYVNQVNEWLIRYFFSKTALKDWIQGHGNWNGVIAYAGAPDRRISSRVLMLAIGSVVTITLATVIHFFVKA